MGYLGYQGEGIEVFSGPLDEDGNPTEKVGPTNWDDFLPILGWQVWYAQGPEWTPVVYNSAETRWSELPDRDVQAIVVFHPRGMRTVVAGHDWYLMEGEGRRLKGRYIPDHAYQTIQRLMRADTWRPPRG